MSLLSDMVFRDIAQLYRQKAGFMWLKFEFSNKCWKKNLEIVNGQTVVRFHKE